MIDNEKSSQLDDIMMTLRVLERRMSRLESSLSAYKTLCDTMGDNVHSLYKKVCTIESVVKSQNTVIDEKFDSIKADIDYLYTLIHGGDNFCGNCEHCIPCPDGLYRCDLTNLELDPDTSSCIRFKTPQSRTSDAEICKACPDIDTPRCYKCSHFPF